MSRPIEELPDRSLEFYEGDTTVFGIDAEGNIYGDIEKAEASVEDVEGSVKIPFPAIRRILKAFRQLIEQVKDEP